MTRGKQSLKKYAHRSLFAGQLLIVSLFFIFPLIVQAQAAPIPLEFKPQIPIPGSAFGQDLIKVGSYSATSGLIKSDLLPRYIMALYNYSLTIVGILATIVLMGGGVLWLTSGGDSGKITQAKELITSSISGTIILVLAWIILNTINPNLVNFKSIDTLYVVPISLISGCCEYGSEAKTVTSDWCKKKGGTFYQPTSVEIYLPIGGKCKSYKVNCNIKKDCDGKIIQCFDADTKITTVENCGSWISPDYKNLYELRSGRCSSQVDCINMVANCMGVKDGEKCESPHSGNGTNGYCYFSMCYIGDGKQSESCGKEPGAFCSLTTCSELGQSGEKYYRDNTGGRECSGDNLFCCYKDNG